MSHNDDNLYCSQKEWRRREQQRLGNMYAQNAQSVRDRETLADLATALGCRPGMFGNELMPKQAQPNPALLLCD